MSKRESKRTISRRDALKGFLLGSAGLAVSGGFAPLVRASGESTPGLSAPRGKAKAVIQIWMWGGPSHIDTFDPKPEAGSDYTGPLNKAIETNVSGIRIGQLLPQLAGQADKYSIIRSMSHGINGHETASYVTQTGHTPGVDRLVYPSVGAVSSLFLGRNAGYDGRIPPYVVMTRPLGRFSEVGFLGLRYKPFVTGGDPNQARFAVEGIVSRGITDERQRGRRELLHDLDTLGRAMPDDQRFADLDRCEDKAYELILGDAGKVFDLKDEPKELRERYGRSKFGQSCLVARRLVQLGVPYIAINYEGWDTHKQHFETMNRKLPEMDRGFATLLSDLSEHGLLDSTIVWWGGEFGRTPKVAWQAPWNGGRSHHGRCFCAVVAGGGFAGGRVLGSTDGRGEDVDDRPVHPRELIATIYGQLGIDPTAKMPNHRGLDVPVLPPVKAGGAPAGPLAEILA